MKTSFLFSLCLLLLSTDLLLAQDDQPNLIPPSPSATAIQRVGVENVNHYTGAADVSVPLYELKLNELSVPIGLNYTGIHGIRVQEIASWVGIGWALNAGGAVSRTQKGLPDEVAGGYYRTGPLPGELQWTEKFEEYMDIFDGDLDAEPDQFNYSAPGISGSFFINKDGTIHEVPLSDNKIEFEFSNNQFTRFIITNTAGVKYYFEDIEESWSTVLKSPINLNHGYVASSWYLTKMINANGTEAVTNVGGAEIINFEYEEENPGIYVENMTQDYITSISGVSTGPSYNLSRTKQLRLKRIAGGIDEILFNAPSKRCDYKDTHYLSEVVINKNGNLLKRYELDYSYLTKTPMGVDYDIDINTPCSSQSLPYDQMMNEQDLERRLKLNTITEYGSNGGELPPYKFEYNMDKHLPHRNSLARDHWGYYNGADNNVSLEPKQYLYLENVIYGQEYRLVGTSNRTPDLDHAKAGILEKITYPTGGFTKFNYELNASQDDEVESDLEFKIASLQSQITGIEKDTLQITVDLIERPFTEVFFEGIGFNATPTCNVRIKAVNANGYNVSGEFNTLNMKDTLLLPSGNYDIIFTSDHVEDCSTGDLFFNVMWYDQIPTLEKKVGGLRIASIENCSEIGNCTEKKYRYVNEDGTSSGNLTTIPDYGYLIYEETSPGVLELAGKGRAVKTNAPLLVTSGNQVGYSRIEVSIENDTLSGKSVYYYTSPKYIEEKYWANYYQEGLIHYKDHPLPPLMSRDWLRGKLKGMELYKFESGEFKLQQKSQYFFKSMAKKLTTEVDTLFSDSALTKEFEEPTFIQGITMYGLPSGPGFLYHRNHYNLPTGRIYQYKQIDSKYEDGRELTTTTEYQYFSDKLLPFKKETVFASGLKHEEVYTYNFEDNSNLSASIADSTEVQALSDMYTDRNIIIPFYSKVRDISDSNNPVTLSQRVSAFMKSGESYFLDEVRVSQDGTTPEMAVKYIQYAPNGLPASYTTQDGMVHTFEWTLDYKVVTAAVASEEFPHGMNKVMLINGQIEGLVDGLYQVSFYQYDSLGRIQTITDINGRDTNYAYDEFSRLIQVTDHEGNVLKQIDYNFKTSN